MCIFFVFCKIMMHLLGLLLLSASSGII
jgi:hypothetical protein